MTAKHPTTTPAPLREQIARHLDAHPESPVKAIAKACGQTDYPSRIVAQLNVMRTDGDVECEQRKGEMRYWLARPLGMIVATPEAASIKASAEAALPPGLRPGTRAAQIWLALGDAALHAADIAKALDVSSGIVAPVLTSMARDGFLTRTVDENGRYLHSRRTVAIQPQPEVGNNTGSDGSAVQVSDDSTEAVAVQETAPAPAEIGRAAPVAEDDVFATAPELQYLAPEDYVMPPADPVLLASANRMLCDRLEGVAHALRGCGLPALTGVTGGEDLQPHVAALSGAFQMARAERDTAEQRRLETTTALTHSMQDLDAIRDLLAPFSGDVDPSDMTEAELAAAAATTIRNLLATVESVAQGEPAVDVLDAARAYVVRTPKRRPRIIVKPERAREAALAAVRGGAPRAEVFALVSVGTARRGVEWKDA